ncbi:MAG: transglutaminase-like domain-containing protein [Chloroflexota bacterium]
MKTYSYTQFDGLAAGLLISAVFTAAVRLDTTNWTPDLGYVEVLAVLGTVLGLAMGLSQFRRFYLQLLLVLYTIFVIPMHLSRIIIGEETVIGQLASLFGRLSVTIGNLLGGKPIEDYIFFVTLMSIIFWFIGIFSGFRLIRNRTIFSVLLPTTIPILIIQYYDGFKPDRIWGLAFYFFLALMLTGRINLLNSRERWEKKNIVAGSDPEFDLNKNIASMAAIIIITAWLLPVPSAVLPAVASAWRNVNEPFETVRKRMDEILAALNTSRIYNTTGELYGDVMGLGRSAGTGEAELFSVVVPDNNLPRLYWRMRTYDTYQNGSWQTLNSQNAPFEPGSGAYVRIDMDPAPVAEFTFTWQTNQSAMLATPSLPVWASRTGSVQVASSQGGETDPLSWSALPILHAGDRYQIRAWLSNPTQKELRESGTDYPSWITERYLQIPDDLAPAFNRLATDVTRDSPTNFDKVEALTNYLRVNISYAETVSLSPPGTDALAWFLFDKKSGFCNYYASAEVMLLRSIGIPARMVVGFAEGEKGDYRIYSVRSRHAHAWPEVYFPKLGWVQFEPTVTQAVLVRPSGLAVTPGNFPNPLSDLPGNSANNSRRAREEDGIEPGTGTRSVIFLGLTLEKWLWVIISGIFLAAVGGLAWSMQRQRSFSQRIPRAVKAIYSFYNLKSPAWVEHWLRWSEVSSVERAFHAVNQSLDWLKKSQPDSVTSFERVMLLKTLLPDASEEIEILNTALEKTLFTNQPADVPAAIRASWQLRLLTIKRIIRRMIYGE